MIVRTLIVFVALLFVLLVAAGRMKLVEALVAFVLFLLVLWLIGVPF